VKRLGRYGWGPPLVVELVSFALAFAVFAGAGGAYAALSGNTGRPIWWVLLPAAIVVAVLLPLVRPSLAATVDRMAHGRQAEGYRMMSDLMTRMAATLEVDEVLPRLAETAARSVHSDRGEVSVWLADGRQWRRTWTPGAGDTGSAGDVTVEVQHQGDIVGELGVGLDGAELNAADQRALHDLAAPAGVALATVRLTVELRRRVAEVAEQTQELQASRRRLVDARRHEQQRTWSRLTATVIPRISAVGQDLDEFRIATKGGTRGDSHLEDAQREATGALEALREMARGIFPALLTDSGLEVALQAWVDRRSPGRQVAVEGDLRPLHRQPAAEAALYFACTQALEETAAAGRIGRDPQPLVLLASDAEVATATMALPAAPEEGTRRAIRDRLEALGGSLRIDPPAGTGADGSAGSGADGSAGSGADGSAGGGADGPTDTRADASAGSGADGSTNTGAHPSTRTGTNTHDGSRPVVIVATVPLRQP